MTTIDTALDASINTRELAGTALPPTGLTVPETSAPAITADYYNLTESDGWPIAGLVVLLDRHHRPVRAEVHLYDNTIGRRQDDALNNANNLLIQRYRSLTEEASKLPLRVMRTRQELDTLSVQLDVDAAPAPAKTDKFTLRNWFRPGMGVVMATAVVIVVLLTTIAILIQRQTNAGTRLSAIPSTTEIGLVNSDANLPFYGDELLLSTSTQQPLQAATVSSETAREPTSPVADTKPVVQDYVNPYPPQTNDLPASTVAHTFTLQEQAQVTVGHLAIQSEPDPDPTFSIAWKEQGSVVQLLGGPVRRAGDTDTIVWWYVRTNDNEEGWMAANGSTIRFLAPLP